MADAASPYRPCAHQGGDAGGGNVDSEAPHAPGMSASGGGPLGGLSGRAGSVSVWVC